MFSSSILNLFISIHAPCEGCDFLSGCRNNLYFQISIHAPCEGCDLLCLYLALGVTLFQSTHPVKGATIISMVNIVYRLISIHAPCEGCDDSKGIKGFGEICISIHAPCEGCDFHFFIIHLACDISIHAPCEGCDFIEKTLLKLSPLFQSTHPVKGATVIITFHKFIECYFNPRTL